MGGWTLDEAEADLQRRATYPLTCSTGWSRCSTKACCGWLTVQAATALYRCSKPSANTPPSGWPNSPDAAALRERHARYFMAFVEDPEFFDAPDAYHRAAEAHDNLRAALGWSLANGQPGCRTPHRHRALDVLDLCRTSARRIALAGKCTGSGHGRAPHIRANALRAAGNLVPVADYQQARVRYEEALALYRTLDDTRGIGSCLNNLANLAVEGDRDYASGQALYEESITLARKRGDTQSEAKYLTNLGLTHMHSGDLALARSNLEAAAALSREAGYAITGWVLASLGMIATRQGDFAQARASCMNRSSGARLRRLGRYHRCPEALSVLGVGRTSTGARGASDWCRRYIGPGVRH